jgi:hypothetical protein
VVTLTEVIKVTHAGYRCPDAQCPGSQRTDRSAAADALALPGFTYGLDIVRLLGRLHLGQHQTVDEVHEERLSRLAPLGVRICRREMLYLFEAYCTLLRASSEAKDDQQWLGQVKKNGGIIVSVDGIQQDERPRDGLHRARCGSLGGCPATEQVSSSETALMKALARPSGGVRGGEEGEGAGHDHRRRGVRALGGRRTVAKGAPSGVPVPRAARRLQVGF